MTEARSEIVDRRSLWTPPARPDWVAHVNAEGRHLDLRGVIPLDAASLIATATANTGLADFGSDDWREPFEIICEGLDTDAELTLLGRIMTRTDMLMLLEARLRVEEAYRQHPEIEEEEIEAPILIIGQGRSGTSALLNLLSADPGVRTMRTWEVMFPQPTGDEAASIALADDRIGMWNRVTPELQAAHEFSAEIPTESIHVESLSFQMPSWQAIYGQTPAHYAYMASRSKVNAIAYEKRVLKLLQWRKPRRRWVLKSPDAINYLPEVLQVYPDIGLVWIHRDPVKALASAVSLVGILTWARSDKVLSAGTFETVTDPDVCAAMMTQPIAWLESGELPPERLCSVHYQDFMADPMAVVETIYRHFHHPMTAEGRTAMEAYVCRNPRSARPAHRYTAEAPSASRERQAFRRYQDYFGVASED